MPEIPEKTLVEQHREELLLALDEAIKQGLLTETDEVKAYRGYLDELQEVNGMAKQTIWPKKPYPFEVAKTNYNKHTGADGEKFHCKNRDYIARPFTNINTPDPDEELE